MICGLFPAKPVGGIFAVYVRSSVEGVVLTHGPVGYIRSSDPAEAAGLFPEAEGYRLLGVVPDLAADIRLRVERLRSDGRRPVLSKEALP